MFPQSPQHLHTSVHSTESTLHWQEFVQFDLRHVQVISLSTDSGTGWFSIHTTESWLSFFSQPWPVEDGISILILIVSSSWDLLCKYCSFFWAVLDHFAFHFPLTALTELQPEIAFRAGRLSNMPSNYLLVPISKILTFEPTLIWTIKQNLSFLHKKLLRWRYHYQLWKL